MIEILAAVAPPVIVLALFVIVIRALIGADRRERRARDRIEAELERRAHERGDG